MSKYFFLDSVTTLSWTRVSILLVSSKGKSYVVSDQNILFHYSPIIAKARTFSKLFIIRIRYVVVRSDTMRYRKWSLTIWGIRLNPVGEWKCGSIKYELVINHFCHQIHPSGWSSCPKIGCETQFGFDPSAKHFLARFHFPWVPKFLEKVMGGDPAIYRHIHPSSEMAGLDSSTTIKCIHVRALKVLIQVDQVDELPYGYYV